MTVDDAGTRRNVKSINAELLATLKALNEFRELMGETLEPEVWLSSNQWHDAHDAAEAAILKAEDQ